MTEKQSKAKKWVSLAVLELTFFAVIIITTAISRNVISVSQNWFYVLFGLAVYRGARTLSFNEVAEWIRAPFCYTEPDSCGAGENVHPIDNKGDEIYVIGSLLSCPICTGTWVSLGLFVIYSLFPDFGTALIIVLGMAAVNEVLHYISEFFSWIGRLARVISGTISPDKE